MRLVKFQHQSLCLEMAAREKAVWEEVSLKTLRTVGTGTGEGGAMTSCFQLKGGAQGG